MKKLNINSFAYVKLTDKGIDIYYHRHDKLNLSYGKEMIKPIMPKLDSNGYLKIQMWELMRIYGEHMGMGFPDVFETTICFDDLDIES